MGTTTESRITSVQAKDAIYKAHSMPSASEINGLINDGTPYCYNLNAGLKRWRQSIAKNNTVKDIIALGDSILEGAGGDATPSEWWSTSWFARLRKKIQSEYGNAGLGVVPCYVPYASSTVQTGFWTYSAGWVKQLAGFGFNGIYFRSAAIDDVATFTFTGESISIIASKGFSLSTNIEFKIDGAFVSNVSLFNGTTINAAEIVVATGLTNTQHVLTITNKEAKPAYLHGAIVKNTVTEGFRLNMLGRSGITTNQYMDASQIYLETCIDFVSNINASGDQLFIVALGANDYAAQMSIATYSSNIQTIINRAKPFGDILLVGYGNRSDVSSPTIQFNEYMTALKDKAIANNVAYIDINALWGSDFTYMNSTLGYIYDVVHPNAGGHLNIANMIKKIILNERF